MTIISMHSPFTQERMVSFLHYRLLLLLTLIKKCPNSKLYMHTHIHTKKNEKKEKQVSILSIHTHSHTRKSGVVSASSSVTSHTRKEEPILPKHTPKKRVSRVSINSIASFRTHSGVSKRYFSHSKRSANTTHTYSHTKKGVSRVCINSITSFRTHSGVSDAYRGQGGR